MVALRTFYVTKNDLMELLSEARSGEAQLPDVQRGWVSDDDHIRDLIASVFALVPDRDVAPRVFNAGQPA